MDKKQKIILLISFTLSLPLLVPIFTYIGNFHELNISDDPEEWGPFGDFFGGVLNTYISFLTLMTTIFIAYEISRLDDRRNEKVLEFEKKRFLNELREAEYRKISIELQRVASLISENKDEKHIKNELFQISLFLTYFTISNDHLFPFLQEDITLNLTDSLKKLSSYYSQTTRKGEDKLKIFGHYNTAMRLFTVQMQKFIMKEF
ncbi:hypothetical protein [Flavobacterium lindanitolerans]|uniref:hypothetical protein n=1 Tax=Flavobacterium lindanitolerans TaxID=428988 RepID=UPI0027B9C017|nr:hypothetical protein [Flavobacterium lindanitolerans]